MASSGLLHQPDGRASAGRAGGYPCVVGAALLALAALAGGCAVGRSPVAAVAAAEWQDWREARRLLDRGERADARAMLRDVVVRAPHFVAAHRALQNLELAEHRRGALLRTYGALRAADPASAERCYLWGRIQSDPEAQRLAFLAAVELDRACPWPRYGLGALALAEGDVAAARDHFEAARRLAPDEPDLELGVLRAWCADPHRRDRATALLESELHASEWDVERVLLLADGWERSGRSRDALELLGRLLARQPRQAEVARRLRARLQASATVGEVEWLVRELELAGDEPLVGGLLARCHALRGDAGAALAAWERFPPIDRAERAARRLLLVAGGDPAGALATDEARYRALASLGFDVSAFTRARALAAAAGGRATDALALAEAFVALGGEEEALALLRPWRRGDGAPIESLRSRLLAQRQIEAELRVLAISTYRRFDEESRALDFDAFVAAIGDASERVIGADLVAPARRLSFWPLGELLDPTGPGLPEWFATGGRLLVAGQRRGAPPELFVAPVVARGIAGPQRAELHFVEGARIPGWLEHRGARFAGAALDRFAWIDVAAIESDVARLLAGREALGPEGIARVRADAVEDAPDRAARLRVAEPAEVALKLELRALQSWETRSAGADPADLLADAIDAVLAHETAHLEDAARFLPISRALWAELPRLATFFFSPRRVEEWLEQRAQAVALARARNPWLVLAECVGQVGGDRLTPHGDGYRDLLARLVRIIDAAPADFPSIARGRVIVQQLDRLSERELALAARRLLAELDLDGA